MQNLNSKFRMSKKIALIFFAFSLCVFNFTLCVAPAHADITTSLVGWWKLDDGGGSTALDSAGSNNGSLHNSPSWVAGKIAPYALSFDGSSQYVSVSSTPSNFNFSSGTFSMSAWIKTTTNGAAILSTITSAGGYVGWEWAISQGLATINPGIPSFYNGSAWVSANTAINDGNWHNIVLTYDGTNIKFYLDGNLDKTVADGNPSYQGNPLLMGHRTDSTYPLYFGGMLDDVRIYSRNLISSDVTQLYAYSPSATGCGVMSSSNYCLGSDSINFGGGYSASANYTQQSTAGEVATGFSSSTNYSMYAGFQQMQTVALSLVPPTSVTMSTSLGGLTGGTSNGSTTFTVTTDDVAGYSATIQASSSPALVNTASSSNTFADYSPVGAAPDYSFSHVTTSQSAFGFSSQGTDADQRFKNNSSVCNSGSSSTAQVCWDGLSTSAKNVANRTSNNQPSGTQMTLWFRAYTGPSHLQVSGIYVATTTLTVVPL